jgi:hypothetical protein
MDSDDFRLESVMWTCLDDISDWSPIEVTERIFVACSVPARRPSWRTKRRAPRKYLVRSASDLAPLIGHRRLRRLRQPFASPEGEGLDPRRGQSNAGCRSPSPRKMPNYRIRCGEVSPAQTRTPATTRTQLSDQVHTYTLYSHFSIALTALPMSWTWADSMANKLLMR